ncbi:MAG: hypothetical protein Q8L69_04140, partial [Gallionellaceae bacterium]|nr:hypothetical protein [Gallionellaceae bacterium]
MKQQSKLLYALASRVSVCVMLMLPFMAGGEEFVGPPEQAPPQDEQNAFDRPRDYLSGKYLDFITSIDRFFGDDRHYQESNDSVVQIDLIRVTGYGGENKFVWSGRAKVKLPIAEQKLHLIVETDPDKNVTVDPKKMQSPQLKQPSSPESYALALRLEKAEAERWHYSADGGIKLAGINSRPFARARARMAVPVGLWRATLAETVFWFNTTGIGSTTQLDMERPISDPLLLRATSSATWLHDNQNFDMRQDISLIQALDDRSALLYQASVVGVSRPQAQVSDSVLLVLYRYRLHREWAFIELSPQLHFPRDRGYRASPM